MKAKVKSVGLMYESAKINVYACTVNASNKNNQCENSNNSNLLDSISNRVPHSTYVSLYLLLWRLKTVDSLIAHITSQHEFVKVITYN